MQRVLEEKKKRLPWLGGQGRAGREGTTSFRHSVFFAADPFGVMFSLPGAAVGLAGTLFFSGILILLKTFSLNCACARAPSSFPFATICAATPSTLSLLTEYSLGAVNARSTAM